MSYLSLTRRREQAVQSLDLTGRALGGELQEAKRIETERVELEDYLADLMPEATVECSSPSCITVKPLAETVTRQGRRYCSDNCADRALAPIVKPEPKGTKINGWDV